MAVRANECLELAVLVGWACYGTILDFNLGLILYCLSRQSLPQLLLNWLNSNQGWGRGNMNWLQLAILFLPFFFFLTSRVLVYQHSSLLFLLIVANRLFRSELLEPVI